MAWLWWIAGGGMFFLLSATWIAYTTNPWTPWQLAGQNPQSVDLAPALAAAPGASFGGGSAAVIPGLPAGSAALTPPNIAPGNLTDAERYQLAVAVGWSPSDAIIATAISIAEDGSGDPNAMSPPNNNRSVDAGEMQINSSHWAECGGLAAVLVPINNFRCGHMIWSRGGWTQWCTYPSGCGGLPGSPYFPTALVRARAAAAVQPTTAGDQA